MRPDYSIPQDGGAPFEDWFSTATRAPCHRRRDHGPGEGGDGRPAIGHTGTGGAPMQIILNSKFFSTLSIDQLGHKARELGYDGVDLCVRPGHPVNPENVETALPPAVRQWAEEGI